MDIQIRQFNIGDEKQIVDLICRASKEVNIKDYSYEKMEKLCEKINEEFILKRAKLFHTYVALDKEKIVGVGSIGPNWNSLTESKLFNVFVLPEYEGQGIGTLIVKTLEEDEYYKRADRIEIPSSITAVEFYKSLGYGFKHLGNISDEEGHYIMEKFPKISANNSNKEQYNMRAYIDNEYHNYKQFIYETKKEAYKKYVEECWGPWNDDVQKDLFEKFIEAVKDDTYIIQLNGKDIGFYNGATLEDGSYEVGNICIIPEYQGKGIGTQVLKDIMELHNNQTIHIQYFKQNPVGKLYERLGFEPNGETQFHYQMKKTNQLQK